MHLCMVSYILQDSECSLCSQNANTCMYPVRRIGENRTYRRSPASCVGYSVFLMFQLGLKHQVTYYYLLSCFSELQLSALEAENLQTESFSTWRTLLFYGLAGDVYQ